VTYAQAEIPRRLATRIRSLEALPFIVGTNPYIARILDGFRKSFLWSATYPQVKNLEENAGFAAQLESLVRDHADDIPTMAKGRVSSPVSVSPPSLLTPDYTYI
jgi:26S proteasome regulatory subunit T1